MNTSASPGAAHREYSPLAKIRVGDFPALLFPALVFRRLFPRRLFFFASGLHWIVMGGEFIPHRAVSDAAGDVEFQEKVNKGGVVL